MVLTWDRRDNNKTLNHNPCLLFPDEPSNSSAVDVVTMDSSAQWGLLLSVHNHQLLFILWHVGFRNPVDSERKTLPLFYIILVSSAHEDLQTHVRHITFFFSKRKKGGGGCFNLRPPVLVATQHINKRQVPAFRGIRGTQPCQD